MTDSRPVIFISAVSRELRTTRDLVAKTLLKMGYEPKWQDIAPTETGDFHSVRQIVGHRHGYGPKVSNSASPSPAPTTPTMSTSSSKSAMRLVAERRSWNALLTTPHPTSHAPPSPTSL